MTRLSWRLIAVLARALEPAERDIVLGDLTESCASLGAATRDLLGLIVRRQAGLWMTWRPWLALGGVSILAGAAMSRIVFSLSGGVAIQLRTYLKYGVRYETGVTALQEIVSMLGLALMVLAWSWACGFVLGSLSGRAVWVTMYVFYVVVLHSAWANFVFSGNIIFKHPLPVPFWILALLPLPPSPVALACFFTAVFGALLGSRRKVIPPRGALMVCLAIVSLTILNNWTGGWYETAREEWSGGVWHGAAWSKRLLPFLLAGWPAAWMLVSAYRHKEETT